MKANGEALQRTIRPYLEVVALVLVASLLRIPIEGYLRNRVPFALYFPIVAFAAWRGGLVLGVVASILSAIAAASLFMPAFAGPTAFFATDIRSIAIFAVAAAAICLLGEQHRKSQLQLAETAAALQDREALLAAAVAAAELGIWHMDIATERLHADDRAQKMFGVGPSVHPDEVFARIDPADQDAVDAAWRAILDPKRSDTLNITFRIVDHGEARHFSVRGWGSWHEGSLKGVVGNILDITDQVNYRRTFEDLNQELERRVEERTDALIRKNEELLGFSYAVSHDLRAPLRAIVGRASIVMDEERDRMTPEGQAHLGYLVSAAVRMSALVDDLLDYARFGRRELHRSSTDLTELATEISREATSGRPGCSIEVEPNLIDDCDPVLISLVLRNLFENACKYSRPGVPPEIIFGRRPEQEPAAYFVQDCGIGFDMAYVEKLFRPFERLHPHDRYEGTGIGLANVKRIIERHGGRVWAEGQPDVGSTFYFTLR